jgi:hypothetical protein
MRKRRIPKVDVWCEELSHYFTLPHMYMTLWWVSSHYGTFFVQSHFELEKFEVFWWIQREFFMYFFEIFRSEWWTSVHMILQISGLLRTD